MAVSQEYPLSRRDFLKFMGLSFLRFLLGDKKWNPGFSDGSYNHSKDYETLMPYDAFYQEMLDLQHYLHNDSAAGFVGPVPITEYVADMLQMVVEVPPRQRTLHMKDAQAYLHTGWGERKSTLLQKAHEIAGLTTFRLKDDHIHDGPEADRLDRIHAIHKRINDIATKYPILAVAMSPNMLFYPRPNKSIGDVFYSSSEEIAVPIPPDYSDDVSEIITFHELSHRIHAASTVDRIKPYITREQFVQYLTAYVHSSRLMLTSLLQSSPQSVMLYGSNQLSIYDHVLSDNYHYLTSHEWLTQIYADEKRFMPEEIYSQQPRLDDTADVRFAAKARFARLTHYVVNKFLHNEYSKDEDIATAQTWLVQLYQAIGHHMNYPPYCFHSGEMRLSTGANDLPPMPGNMAQHFAQFCKERDRLLFERAE